MDHLNLLLPFSLLKIEIARIVLQKCKAPALTKLLTCATIHTFTKKYNLFSRALPHEYWFASQFGLPLSTTSTINSIDRGNSPPIAIAILRTFYPQNSSEGYWFIVQPVNFYVTSNHLILTAINQLDLTEIKSRKLYQSAQLLCAQYNHILLYVNTKIWLLRADNWAGLRTSSLLTATNRNIEAWMPVGPGAGAWRKLQNEIQIQWFNEMPNINDSSQSTSPNSLWLWGGASAQISIKNTIYQSNFNFSDWMEALIHNHQKTHVSHLKCILQDPAANGLLMLDTLLEPGLFGEWEIWLERLTALEKCWFDPLLQALRNKQLNYLSMTLSNQQNLIHMTITRLSLKKFWLKSNFTRLIA